METHYCKIYSGNFLTVQILVTELDKIGIVPIVKDESESARLAGFGTFNQGNQDIYVHNDNYDRAKTIIDTALTEIEAS